MNRLNNQIKQTAVEAAKIAGKILMGNIEKIKINEISYDNYSCPTTKVDKESELKITEIIKSNYPGHNFLGEELGENKSKSEYKWIIDPIDGTNNYVAKRDTFSVSIGLEYRGEIILAVVYLPKRDELFVAEKGKGAKLNGKAIHVGNVEKLFEAIITYSVYPGCKEVNKKFHKKIIDAIPQIKYFGFKNSDGVDAIFGKGSMAAEFCYLACGRIDGLIRLKQKPWDVAAGSLVAAEAGAKMFNLNGKKCSIYEGDYVAGNAKIVKQILEILKV